MKRPVLTCTTAALLLGFAAHASLAQQADTFSPVVSYQFQEDLGGGAGETTIMSPVVSYQYYDWPGDENVPLTNSPYVSYRYDGPPSIRTEPVGRVVRAGERLVHFRSPLMAHRRWSYQWRLNGVALGNTNSSAIQISNVQPANSGAYSVVVTNGYAPAAVSNDARLLVYVGAPGPTPSPPSACTSDTAAAADSSAATAGTYQRPDASAECGRHIESQQNDSRADTRLARERRRSTAMADENGAGPEREI